MSFKVEIKNRYTGDVQITAEIKRDTGNYRVNLGLAVKWALESGADLTKANLSGAILTETDLYRADLTGANLFKVDLTEAKLARANLSKTNLIEANLSRADLTEAKLSEAKLIETNLSRTNLIGAELSKANLCEANLSRAYLIGVNLSGANLCEANLFGADLTGTNLSRAALSRADLSRTILTKVSLTDADLSEAKLSGADLTGANLFETDLTGANLAGANLTEARNTQPERCTPLLMLLDQPGSIHAYKLVNEYAEGIYKGGLRYEIGKPVEAPDACDNVAKDCGAGISLATLDWCMREWCPGCRILVCEFTASDIAAIPTATDGKFRVRRCTPVAEKDLVALGLIEFGN